MYIRLSLPLSFLDFRRKDFFTLLMQRNQPRLLEQLPLSLCTYPFFILSLFYEPFFVFGKQDLAQDCPFFIPGFL